MSNLRILHCPTTVGGNPQGLVQAERMLGYDSKSVSLRQNFFNFKPDEVILNDDGNILSNEFKVWRAAFHALKDHDVLHYNYGQSLSPFRAYPTNKEYAKWKVFLYTDLYAKYAELLDVRAAKLLKKVVAVTYQGDDARQGDYCLENYDIHFARDVDQSYYSDSSNNFKRHRIAVFEKNADLIYSVNPDLLNVLPSKARFTPYASVDPRKWTPHISSESQPNIPHIVHAPSDRKVKGTKYILDTLERLKAEGIQFRCTLVEGMSNDEARRVYETADLLIDQVLAGYYGALAVELMALGKPVVCYIRHQDMRYLPEKMRNDMPIINANPDSLYDVLKEYLTVKKHNLQEIGALSRKYAETWHDPLKIAEGITQDYERVAKEKATEKKVNA